MFGIGERIQNADFLHVPGQELLELLATRRIGEALEPLQDGFAVLEPQVLILREALIGVAGGGLQLLT